MRLRGFHILGLCIGLMISLVLWGCTANDSQESEGDGVVRVTLRLSAASSSTRADANATADEMMKNYIVIVVNSKGVIEKYFAGNITTSDEKEVKTIATNEVITFGKKTIYSFANMTLKDIGFDSTPQIGDKMPDNFDSRTFATNGNLMKVPEGGIPMSNKQEIEVTEDTKTIELKVKRLYAKMKLTITNDIGKTITISKLTLSDITANGENIPLLPPTAAQPLKTTSLSLLSTESTESIEAIEGATESSLTIEAGKSLEATFYLNESPTPSNDFGLFIIDITYTADGSTEQQARYAMISTDEEDVKEKTEGSDDWYKDADFDVINRNDYLEIPIVISTYRLGLNVVDFAPIGVVTTVKTIDNYTLCHFTMPDIHFHLIPKVLNGETEVTSFTIAPSNNSYIKTIKASGTTLYATDSSITGSTGSDASHNGGSPVWDKDKKLFFGKIASEAENGAFATHLIKAKVTDDITLRYYFKVEYSGKTG